MWLHETKPSESILSDVCHGLSLLRPALSLFVSLDRGPAGEQLWYVREGETLAYRQSGGHEGAEAVNREYGPVGFLQAAFEQFCLRSD
ncbi:hypothetical protein APY03_0618 [Variovorax sp. WDL1]|nr:hypothetical protein APY03_0618 [Variovorax sp. WDL1]